MTDTLRREAATEARHFDKCYAAADKSQQLQNYIMPRRIVDQVLHPDCRPLIDIEYAYSLLGALDGKTLLDFGAGDGWTAICFAKAKAKVWAIDISEAGIALVRKKALANNVQDLVIAEVRNCYDTQFPANHFDLIFGCGILHHLQIESVRHELARILRPDGVAVFFEPIRDTRIMDSIKSLVLRMLRREASEETENETPLTSERIRQLTPCFRIVNHRRFNVFAAAAQLIQSRRWKRLLSWLDYFFMKWCPPFRQLGRVVVVELREPVKTP